MIKLVRALVIAASWLLLNVSDAISQEMPVLLLRGNAYVELPRNLFDGTTEATIEVWVQWNRFNKWSRVFDFGREGNAMVLQNENTSNKLNYRIWDRSGKRYGTQSDKINAGVWYHIATVSGPGGMEFYINGQLVDKNNYVGSLSEVAGGRNYIGKSNWVRDGLFHGYISELRIWSKRRSQSEIRFFANKALSGKEDGLLAYYRFTDVDDDQVPNVVDIDTSAKLIGAPRLVNVPAIAPSLVPTEDDRRAETHYEKARAALEAQEFDVAISEFKKLTEIYPTYKNANRLHVQALLLEAERQAEKFYQTGIQNSQQGNYRQAYYNFESALNQVTHFKDAQMQMQTSLEKARYRVAIYPFKSTISSVNIAPFQQALTTNLINDKSVFVEYMDQQTLNQIFANQEIDLSLIDPTLTLATAKDSDIRVVVFGDLLKATATKSSPYQEGKVAYTLWVYPNGQIAGKGPQQTYYIVSQSVQVNCEAVYKIMDTQTGSILRSGTVLENLSDKVEYAIYHGNADKLYSSVTMGGDGQWKATPLHEPRFTARKDLRNTEDLMNEALRSVAQKMANETNSFTSSYSPISQ